MKVVVPDAPARTPAVLLLRSYGHGTSGFIDRDAERVTLLALAANGYAPPLYARFRNGLAYGFVPGRVVQPAELVTDKVSVSVARGMAKWHRLDLAPWLDLIQSELDKANGVAARADGALTSSSKPSPLQRQPIIWSTLKRWISQGTALFESIREY